MSGMRVTKIIIKKGRVDGVGVGGEFFRADMVIYNGDIKQTVLDLVGPKHFETDYINYVKGLQYSWGGPIMRLALDKELTDIKMLTQFGTTDQEGYYNDLEIGIIPGELNLFLVVPSNSFPSLVPEGKQLVNLETPVPLNLPKGMDKKLEEAMLTTVEKYIPRVRDHIIWKEYLTSTGLDKMVGEQGAGIGIGQRPGQVGK